MKPTTIVVHQKNGKTNSQVAFIKNIMKEEKFLAKHKWGTKQGNFMKVHPLDRK